ncbi:hypothetical protein ACFX12_022652 [Malus domestica]
MSRSAVYVVADRRVITVPKSIIVPEKEKIVPEISNFFPTNADPDDVEAVKRLALGDVSDVCKFHGIGRSITFAEA